MEREQQELNKINEVAQQKQQNEVNETESLENLLKESLGHEEMAIDLYKNLLDCAENKSLYVEEYAREMIKQEEMHSIEIKKMLRDYEV